MKKKSFAVIGAGKFGQSLIAELLKFKQKVSVFDQNKDVLKTLSPMIDYSAALDSTNRDALKSISIDTFDCVVVAISSDKEASILTVALLKELGVKNIIAKADDERVSRILDTLGANIVVNPEKDSGARLAHRLLHNINVQDVIPLDHEKSIVYIKVNSSALGNSNIANLNIRKTYGINIVAIKRKDQVIIPQATDIIALGDILIVVGVETDVTKFEELLS